MRSTNILGQGEYEAQMQRFRQPMKRKKVILLSNAIRIAKEADEEIKDLRFHKTFQDARVEVAKNQIANLKALLIKHGDILCGQYRHEVNNLLDEIG